MRAALFCTRNGDRAFCGLRSCESYNRRNVAGRCVRQPCYACRRAYHGHDRKRGLSKWIAPLPAVIINALVIGAVLCYGYKVGAEYYDCALYVALGEAISCYAVGMPVCAAIRPIEKKLFG